MRKAVITLGISSPAPTGHPGRLWQDYRRGIARLKESLASVGFSGEFMYWDSTYPRGCPHHEETEYAFKPFCFVEVAAEGVQLALWLDSSIYPYREIDTIFEEIRSNGYLFVGGTHFTGEYCTDDALSVLGVTREQALAIPSCSSGILGLNFECEIAREFLARWHMCARDGRAFRGPKWSGVRGFPVTVSTDPRVKGHRHDQTVASILAWQLGMRQWKPLDVARQVFRIDRDYVRKLDEPPAE